MSESRNIWMKAIQANQELVLNRSKGETTFKRLLQSHPEDGMIYYERGEAYEYLKEFDLAETDYQTASKLLYAEHWREVARKAIARVQRKRQSPSSEPQQELIWSIFHRIHTLPYLPHEIRYDTLSAITRLDSEPHSTALLLRLCLESLVLILLDSAYVKYSDNDGVEKKIELLEEFDIVPSSIVAKMDAVRALGNKAAHPKKRRYIQSYAASAAAFIEVSEWANEYLRRKQSG
jgi:hypothetical protein